MLLLRFRFIRGVLLGALVGGGVLATMTARRWARTWGIDPVEFAATLPGDELVPDATAIDTRGITIDAPPHAVWPWLAQMGFGRAGWYSYDAMDIRGTSANEIVDAWQPIKVGDIVPTAPDGGFEAKVVEPDHALVLYTDTALVESQERASTKAPLPAGLAASSAMLRTTPRGFKVSWAFVLEPAPGDKTRLVERVRAWFDEPTPGFRIFGRLLGFGVFVMVQRQLIGIRTRAEGLGATLRVPLRTDEPAAEAPTAEPHANGPGADVADEVLVPLG